MSKLQMLQSLSPRLYQDITAALEEQFRVHSYDIQLIGEEKDTGIRVIVKYGENFDHEAEHFFTFDSIGKDTEAFHLFIEETGEACKKVLIEDYFRTMTP